MSPAKTELAQKQAAFMQAILDEDAALPEGWGNRHALGISVYRGNYRSALVTALTDTFERTARYVGEVAFKQASAHHVIANPPASWTIDDAGEGFDTTCDELFGENPEVAELARLEWVMLQVSTSADRDPLTPSAFGEATAEFADDDWMSLRVEFQPRAAAWVTEINLTALWNTLEEGGGEMPEPKLAKPLGCIVWREGERPTFAMVGVEDANAFAAMQSGATYGDLVTGLAGESPDEASVQDAAQRAGGMLGGWLSEGMIVGLNP